MGELTNKLNLYRMDRPNFVHIYNYWWLLTLWHKSILTSDYIFISNYNAQPQQ